MFTKCVPVDVVTFVENVLPSGVRLSPVQRVVLKAYYGLPLDGKETFVVSDYKQDLECPYTEVSYLQHLYAEGRSNIAHVEGPGSQRELVLVAGRRGGKTFLSSLIVAYEAYKLLAKYDPQTYYGFSANTNIGILSVSVSKEQASILKQELEGLVKDSVFAQFLALTTQNYLLLQTQHNIDQAGRWDYSEPGSDIPSDRRATIRASFRSCIAKGICGSGHIAAVFDDPAHFSSNGLSSKEDAFELIYNAATPVTASFSPKDPQDNRTPIGKSEGRIASLSTPHSDKDFFHRLFQTGFKTAPGRVFAEEMLCLQIPTWELNPSIPALEYDRYYARNPDIFMTEFGAEWPKEKTQPIIVSPAVSNVKGEPMTDTQNLEGKLSELVAALNVIAPDMKVLADKERVTLREEALFLSELKATKKEIQSFLANLANTPAPAGEYAVAKQLSAVVLSDMFELVEVLEHRVTDIVLNARDYADLYLVECECDMLDFKSSAIILKTGHMASLWGAKIWTHPDCPIGQVFVLGADKGFDSGTLTWSKGIITKSA